ncbi:hypothetical protein [Nitratifractor sp.]
MKNLLVFLLFLSSLFVNVYGGELQESAGLQLDTCRKIVRYIEKYREEKAALTKSPAYRELLAELDRRMPTLRMYAKSVEERALVDFIAICLAELHGLPPESEDEELHLSLVRSIADSDWLLLLDNE